MEQKIENGKMDIMGINIDISQVLGQKIIDQYIRKNFPEAFLIQMPEVTI